MDHFRQSEIFYNDHAALYESLRRHRNLDLVIWLIVMAVAAPVSWAVAFYLCLQMHDPYKMHGHDLLLPAVLIYCTFGLASFLKADADHRAFAKRKLLPALAAAAGLQYRPGGFFRLVDIYDHRLLPPYDCHTVEEGFKGRRGSFDIAFEDFVIEPALERFPDMDWRDLRHAGRFRGVAIVIPLSKRLNFHTVLLRRGRVERFLKLAFSDRLTGFERVDFPYNALYRHYAVIATNQVEARYVLDPAVLQRLMALKRSFGARWIEVSFRESEMAIVLNYPENAFEVGTLARPVSLLRTEAFLDQVGLIYSIIDTMELSPFSGLGGPGTGVSAGTPVFK